MDNTTWILISTKTTSLTKPVHVVEIAAQRMSGWEKEGEPFFRVINHGYDTIKEESQIRGHTSETLECNVGSPNNVYCSFSDYAQELPIVAYDLDDVWNCELQPELKRLGIAPIGYPGLCAYKLTQRLLDPLPSGDYKLEVLRQYYKLPAHDTESALGNVEILADLMKYILRPIALHKELDTWQKLHTYATAEWYPCYITFGSRMRGVPYNAASHNLSFKSWLEWLAGTLNQESSRMGRWYLQQLQRGNWKDVKFIDASTPDETGNSQKRLMFSAANYRLVNLSRDRLERLEFDYCSKKIKIKAIKFELYKRLNVIYQDRDRLRILVKTFKLAEREIFGGVYFSIEESSAECNQELKAMHHEYDSEYSKLECQLKTNIHAEDDLELLCNKLVSMRHDPQCVFDPEKRQIYEQLNQSINHARDHGDVESLVAIANNHDATTLYEDWKIALNCSRYGEPTQVIYEHLQKCILEVTESLYNLKNCKEYELYKMTKINPSTMDEIEAEQKTIINEEITKLQADAARCRKEINELDNEEGLETSYF
jgi:DNA polymerase-3 subunit epsilon